MDIVTRFWTIIFLLKRFYLGPICLPVRGHVVSVVTTTRAHVFREYLRENEKIRETVFAF